MIGRTAATGMALVSLLLAACGPARIMVREIPSPAAPGSAEPSIETGADGRTYLSWIETLEAGRHALRFSVWEGTGWSAPRTVASGSDWFVNWADFPSITALDDDTLVAHWLRKTGGDTYAYGVALSVSRDDGTTWGEPFAPHDDSPTEHGFVSNVPLPGGRYAAIWLDGRETAGGQEGHSGPMTLRTAFIAKDGRIEREDRIDARVCDCCQTSAVRLDDGAIVVAYRDRSESEIRDIAIARFDGVGWSEPKVVHDDRWEMPGCPVNGPAIAAVDDTVAVAWFTAAGPTPTPRVRIAFSRDGGREFDAPIDVDTGRPAGRVDVVVLENGFALVTWIESGEGSARILARRVDPGGALGPPVPVATVSASRAAGFPRIAPRGRDVVVAWTEPGDPPRVRTALLALER